MLKSLTTWSLLAGCLGLAGTPAKAAPPDDCATLNAASLNVPLLATLKDGVAAAEADFAAHGVNGDYAIAAKYSRDYLVAARKKVQDLQDWLTEYELDGSNASAAANINGYLRAAIGSLQEAEWWSLVSASYHRSADAANAFERSTDATDLANAIARRAGRCYLGQYM
jgi:hypothetical protein